MKKITLAFASLFSVAMMYSCSNNSGTDNTGTETKDPVEVAKDSNEQKEDSSTMAVNEDDSKFLVFAADAGMTEVEAAKLAKTKPMSAKTKAFADMMIKDYTAAGEEVRLIASKKMVTIPASFGEDHQKSLTDLSEKNGC